MPNDISSLVVSSIIKVNNLIQSGQNLVRKARFLRSRSCYGGCQVCVSALFLLMRHPWDGIRYFETHYRSQVKTKESAVGQGGLLMIVLSLKASLDILLKAIQACRAIVRVDVPT